MTYMGKGKMKQCKSCGAEIASSAKICPKCGAKNKKPLYARPWFIVLIAFIVIGAAAGSMGGSDETGGTAASGSGGEKEQKITYTPCDAGQLMDALNDNAMKAAETYKDQYVEVTGQLSNIDSSGDYISIVPTDDPYVIIGIQCYIKTEEQKAAVMDMSIDDVIVVKGKIRDVGEVMGYSLDMDGIAAK